MNVYIYVTESRAEDYAQFWSLLEKKKKITYLRATKWLKYSEGALNGDMYYITFAIFTLIFFTYFKRNKSTASLHFLLMTFF
jgi:hypothetical protein